MLFNTFINLDNNYMEMKFMSNNRPPIPADLKRKVLIEAGHRC
ncbi:unnamed protein product, partial [marine sediment metagenome]